MPHSPLEPLGVLPDQDGAKSRAHRLVLGGPFGAESVERSSERLAHFACVGGLLVETSHSYANGQAEEAIGQWLRRHPGRLGVITKIGHDTAGGDLPLDRETVRAHTAAALKNLAVDAVDILLYHCDDPARPVAELADTLVGLVDAGYARRVGASNWRAVRLAELAAAVAARGHTLAASYQYSLAEPDPALLGGSLHADDTVLDVVRENGLPLLTWSSQARGYFAHTVPRLVNGRPDPYDTAVNRARRGRCRELAEELGTRPETVALAWSLHHPGVWPSIGPRTTEQIDSSLEALCLPLTDEQAAWLRRGH